VTRPRAADDFATIRARMKEMRRECAPRAADDFAAIRARMEELRRERAQMLAARDPRPLCPRPDGRRLHPGMNMGSRWIGLLSVCA